MEIRTPKGVEHGAWIHTHIRAWMWKTKKDSLSLSLFLLPYQEWKILSMNNNQRTICTLTKVNPPNKDHCQKHLKSWLQLEHQLAYFLEHKRWPKTDWTKALQLQNGVDIVLKIGAKCVHTGRLEPIGWLVNLLLKFKWWHRRWNFWWTYGNHWGENFAWLQHHLSTASVRPNMDKPRYGGSLRNWAEQEQNQILDLIFWAVPRMQLANSRPTAVWPQNWTSCQWNWLWL